MPLRRSNLGLRTRRAQAFRRVLANRTDEERASANELNRQRMAQVRADETAERRAARLDDARLRARRARSAASDLLRSQQNELDRLRFAQIRQNETPDQRQTRLRGHQSRDLNQLAFRYNPAHDYSLSRHVLIGSMNYVCPYCKALKFIGECKGMCCAAGKIKLSQLIEPPEPLKTLLAGYTADSIHFLSNIRKYNSCFQMTSFGAEIITFPFMPTFKVKGQIYHKSGSLLPLPDGQHKFLQMYFIGDGNDELNARCSISTGIKRSIVSQLQDLLHERNNLVRLFKTAIDIMPSDTHKIVIDADKTPHGEHVRRFNSPTIDEVAIVIVGDQIQTRDIILHRRNNQLKKVSETHRCYDALQYPIISIDIVTRGCSVASTDFASCSFISSSFSK